MTYPMANRLDQREGRELRARRIAKVLEDFAGIDVAGRIVLDLGASHLHITRALAGMGAYAIGLDVDHAALRRGLSNREQGGALDAIVARGECLPFAEASLDVVVCNHVYEHAADAHAMIHEIRRALKPGGVCYFSGGHKYQIMEPHYRLPFLSWLPGTWATRYIRLAGQADHYDIRFLTLPGLQALLAPFDDRQDVTADMLLAAGEYELGTSALRELAGLLPRALVRSLSAWSPTRVWILKR